MLTLMLLVVLASQTWASVPDYSLCGDGPTVEVDL